MIFEETFGLIKKEYPGAIDGLAIDDVKIGPYLTAVRLSDGSCGTSATLCDDLPVCAKGRRDFGDFTPLKIKGQKAGDLLLSSKESALISTLKTAVLSAISSQVIMKGNYNVVEDCDPVEMLGFKTGDNVVVVGGFQSYIRKISQTGCRLTVLEKNENCLTGDQKTFYMPAEEYMNILPLAERFQHSLILRNMRHDAQFYLRIVNRDQPGARRGDEALTHASAKLRPDGDVLQVRVL